MNNSSQHFQTLSPSELLRFINSIKRNSEFDFCGYSQNSIIRRVLRILSDYSIDLNQLIERIESDSLFVNEVINKITVNTTEFFRNPQIWENIYKTILLKFKEKEEINIWIAGCSTGEEVYSLMMILFDMNILDRCNIIATDINDEVLENASKGIYKYLKHKERLANYYRMLHLITKNKEMMLSTSNHFNLNSNTNTFQFVPTLLNKSKFIKHDLCSLCPPSDNFFDLILCRNVMIYFTSHQQAKVNDFFWDMLKDDGFLVLGKDEMIVGHMLMNFNKVNTFYKKNKFNIIHKY